MAHSRKGDFLRKGVIALAGLVLLAAGVWLGLKHFFSDERRIERRLAELAQTASIQREEGNIARMAKANKLTGFFTKDVTITVTAPGVDLAQITGRDELMQAYMGMRGIAREVVIELLETHVKVAPDRDAATAYVAARALVNGEPEGVQELKFLLRKDEGAWLISQVETVHTLQ